eukprot:gene276-8504_t
MSESAASAPATEDAAAAGGGADELVEFRVVFERETHIIEFGLDRTIVELKQHLEKTLNCPAATQKLMYKGPVKDADTLRSKKWKKNCKVLLIGATAAQVIKMTQDESVAKPAGGGAGSGAGTGPEAHVNWNDQTMHKKVIEKGKPADVPMGYENGGAIEPLQDGLCIKSVYDGRKNPLRITIKLSEGSIMVSSKVNQQTLGIHDIASVTSQPIRGHMGYHILALKLQGRKSEMFLYWFPAQYIGAFKNLCAGYQ